MAARRAKIEMVGQKATTASSPAAGDAYDTRKR